MKKLLIFLSVLSISSVNAGCKEDLKGTGFEVNEKKEVKFSFSTNPKINNPTSINDFDSWNSCENATVDIDTSDGSFWGPMVGVSYKIYCNGFLFVNGTMVTRQELIDPNLGSSVLNKNLKNQLYLSGDFIDADKTKWKFNGALYSKSSNCERKANFPNGEGFYETITQYSTPYIEKLGEYWAYKITIKENWEKVARPNFNRLGIKSDQNVDREIIEINPKSMTSLKLGIKAKNEQRYRRAKLYFNRAIEYDPNNYRAYSYRGYVNRKLGYEEESLSDYDMALKINPKFGLVYRQRGYLKELKGDTKGACLDYQKAKYYNDPVAAEGIGRLSSCN